SSRRRHTISKRDWSSDVCSSDLTYDYNYLPDENRYEYKSGSIYYSPVSLTVDIILSDSQLKNGWDTDYLGMYEYVESYTSAQGRSEERRVGKECRCRRVRYP